MYHHIKRHAKRFAAHIKTHHQKYLFSIVGGGLFVKLAIFVVTGLGVSVTLTTLADVQTGCYTTGQYLTGGYQTGGYYTGEYLTGGYYTGGYLTGGYQTGGYYTGEYLTGCYTTGEYLTGGYFSGEERTGEYLTGGYETGCYLTGEYYTGEYFTGEYLTGQEFTGQYLTGGYRTGYYTTGQYLTGGYVTGCITLDTTKPSITGITVTLNGVSGSYIGLNGIAKITFTASEELTGNVVSFRGAPSVLLSKSGLQYTYQQTLSSGNNDGLLLFSVAYKDLAGNTGFYSATGPVTFDKTAPVITGFVFSGNDIDGFTIARQTTENTRYYLNYIITGLSGNVITGAAYGTSFNHLITGTSIGKVCNFQLNAIDRIGNSTFLTGKIDVGTNGIVSFAYGASAFTLASMNTGTVYVATSSGTTTTGTSTTGNLASFAITLQNEINKFNDCKNSVTYRDVNLTIQGNDFALRMPTFQKDTVKQLVQAFTVYMISTFKNNENLTVEDLNILTKRFNSVLVILKLVRDDENECKQSLSNYHIMQFQKAMAEFGLNI